MPRRLGYIIVALAAVLGVGALLLPLPEQVEVQTNSEAPPAAAKSPRPPTTPAVPSRQPRKPDIVPQPTAKPPPAPPPAPPPFPMQDTTKTRTMVQPSQPKE